MPRSIVLLAFATALVAMPQCVLAQDDVTFVAQQRYDTGLAAYEAGALDDALTHFRASFAVARSPNTRLMIARTLRNLGRLAEAVVEYDLAAREATDRAQTEARFDATRDAASSEGAALRPSTGSVRVSIAQRPPSLAIWIGERQLPLEALDVALPADPGTTIVRATAPGYADAAETIEVMAGREIEVVLTLSPLARTEPSLPVTAAPASTSAAEIAAWTSVALVAVVAGTASAFFVAAGSRFQGLVSQCGNAACPSSLRGAIDEGRTFELGGDILAAVAGASALAAIVSFIVWSTEGPRLGVTASREGLQLTW